MGSAIGVSIQECSGRCEDEISVDKEEQKTEIIALVETHTLVMGERRRASKESFTGFGEQRDTMSWKPRENQERESRCSAVSKL